MLFFDFTFPPYLQSSLRVIAILIMSYVGHRVVRRLTLIFHHFMLPAEHDMEQVQRVETLERVLRYVLNAILLIVLGMLLLSEFGISLAPILGAAGVVGVAVGFGAQSLVKDFFSGFFILLENQFRKGDVVNIAGKDGRVEDITLRYTRLRDFSGNVHFVPNGLIESVTNMTLEYSYALIDVGVAYRENLDEVFARIRKTSEIMKSDTSWSSKILEPIELVGVEEWADSAVVIRSRWKTRPLEQWNVRREFLKRLKSDFDQHQIEIPFPHLTIYAGESKSGPSPKFPVQILGG